MMTQQSLPSNLSVRNESPDNRDEIIRDLASQAAQFSQLPWEGHERRAHQRLPYPRLIRLVPLADDIATPAADPIYVVGKNLALLGLDFYHHQPITQRYVVVSLEIGPDRWTHFVLKLSWCRFLHPGWYDSGGRFVKVLDEFNDAEDKNEFDEARDKLCLD